MWEGGDFSGATWEDQTIVFKQAQINQFPQLIKYLLFRKLELALIEKRSLQPIFSLFSKYFPLQSKIKDSPLRYVYEHFKNNTPGVSYLLPSDNYN